MANLQPTKRAYLRPMLWLASLIAFWMILPPFHVRHIDSSPQTANSRSVMVPAAFDAQRYAQSFWNEKLLPAANQAIDAATLAGELARDPAAAAQRYGRRTGLGGKAFYLVRGTGRVTSVDRKGVWISLDDHQQMPVLLVTGPIFGNALRDATNLLDMKAFSSFDFNALSTELNRIAETQIQPQLQRATAGMRIAFSGCAESDASTGKLLLKVVSLSVEYPT